MVIDTQEDAHMTNEQLKVSLQRTQSNESQLGRASYLSNLAKNTKTRRLEIADMKLIYEEQLEEKNQRIAKLESKNKKYLDVIAQRDELIN